MCSISQDLDQSFKHQSNNQNDPLFFYKEATLNYINDKNNLYKAAQIFFENNDNESEDFDTFKKEIDKQNFDKDHDELVIFFRMIKSFADNHTRSSSNFINIKQAISYLYNRFKPELPSIELFKIFESNKLILLYLFQSKILTFSEEIYTELNNMIDINGTHYSHFFYPEIKAFVGEEKSERIKKDLLSNDLNFFDSFEEKRNKGENDSYICTLIQTDSVIDFIKFINQNNNSLKSEIKPSIFETNRFLIKNNPSLIEYAAFYGSIEIFQYLKMNKVDLTSSLWLY